MSDLTGVVLRAVYGRAKGRAGVFVAVASIATRTGLDEADVSRAAALLVRDGRALDALGPTRVDLSPAGAAAAKADAEHQSGVAFAD